MVMGFKGGRIRYWQPSAGCRLRDEWPASKHVLEIQPDKKFVVTEKLDV